MWRSHDKSALRDIRNLFQGNGEMLKVAVLPLVFCYVSFYAPSAGLLIPKGGRRRSQADETSLEIPLDFDVEKPSVLKIPRLTDNLTSKQLDEFPFTQG